MDGARRTRFAADDGVATPVEMMYLLVFCVMSVVFLGFVGRLHATAVQVTNAAQSAARAASLAPTPTAAEQAARDTVARSPLSGRCAGGGRVTMRWTRSAIGSWQGGTVTVAVACTVRNQSLTGVWSPGTRVVTMSDTQSVDRYRR